MFQYCQPFVWLLDEMQQLHVAMFLRQEHQNDSRKYPATQNCFVFSTNPTSCSSVQWSPMPPISGFLSPPIRGALGLHGRDVVLSQDLRLQVTTHIHIQHRSGVCENHESSIPVLEDSNCTPYLSPLSKINKDERTPHMDIITKVRTCKT
jgi:hypothetical protein